jgi:hypothetical protein
MLHAKVGPKALPANIRLGWKGSQGTNTVAYYEHLKMTDVKSFITLPPSHWHFRNAIAECRQLYLPDRHFKAL